MVQAARGRLLMIAIAILLCPAVATHTAPVVNDPVPVICAVCESDFLVNGIAVPSRDVQFSNFTMQSTVTRKTDFDPTLLHSVALQSKHGSFKAAVLQLISWLAQTMIMAWNLLWSSHGTKDACKHRQSPVVQICRARFVGNRRVKTARRFWVDVMLRALHLQVKMIAEQMQEQSPESESKLYKSFVYRGGGKKPYTSKQKEQIKIIYDGLRKLLQYVEEEADTESETEPPSPEEQLFASLQNIVRQAQVNGTSGLIQKLKALVTWFEQEPRQESNRTNRRVSFDEAVQAPNNKQSVAESPGLRSVLVESPSQSAPPEAPTKGPKTKDAPRRPVPVIAGKLCSKWREN